METSDIVAAMRLRGPIAQGDLLPVSRLSHAPPRLTAESAETTEPRSRPTRFLHRENKNHGWGWGSADSALSVVELGRVELAVYGYIKEPLGRSSRPRTDQPLVNRRVRRPLGPDGEDT